MTPIRSAPVSTARDFPFYNGRPVNLSLARWSLMLAMLAAGFLALVGAPHFWPGQSGRSIGVLLFVGVSMLGLALAAGRHLKALFAIPSAREIWIALAFAPLTMIVAGLVAVAIMRVSVTADNPSASLLETLRGFDLAAFLGGTIPQLFGEELITILPLLALLAAFYQVFRTSRRTALILAWIISALVFAALHLPTYQWHLAQALAVIGASRLMLTLPYLITKKLWASTITHVTHDWAIFLAMLAHLYFR